MWDFSYPHGVLLLLVDLACIVHILRTGRPWWWLLVIFLAPLLGALAYVLFEVVGKGLGGDDGRPVPFGSASGNGRESVGKLRRLVDQTPTVENQTRLAAALLRRGNTREALDIYEACLDGVYAEDKTLWYELAEAYHADGQDERALEYLDRLESNGFKDYRDRRELLTALSLERLGRAAEALPRLERLVATFPGQEANYHYARILSKEGEREKAEVVVRGMLERRRSHDARYRQREDKWYKAARKVLAGKTDP